MNLIPKTIPFMAKFSFLCSIVNCKITFWVFWVSLYSESLQANISTQKKPAN